MKDVFINLIVVIISQNDCEMCVYEIIMYTNLHNVKCQLHLIKLRGEKTPKSAINVALDDKIITKEKKNIWVETNPFHSV